MRLKKGAMLLSRMYFEHLSDTSVEKLLLHLAGMTTVAQHTQQLHYQQQIFSPLYLPETKQENEGSKGKACQNMDI